MEKYVNDFVHGFISRVLMFSMLICIALVALISPTKAFDLLES